MSRRWSKARQARYPRLWPVMLVGAVVMCTALPFYDRLDVDEPWGLLLWLALNVVFAGATLRARWMVWERRHPVVPAEHVAREAARWN